MKATRTRIRSKKRFLKGGVCVKKEKIKSQEAKLTMEALRERLEELKEEEFILSIPLQIGDDDDDEKA